MSEGDPKERAVPSIPASETERTAALAKKLGRALGRQATGARALEQQPTPAPRPQASPPTSNPITAPAPTNPPTSRTSTSEREAVLAARRASLVNAEPRPSIKPSIKPSARPKPSKPRTRTSLLVLGVLLLVAGLAVGGVYVKQLLDDRSPPGRVRNELLNAEFAIQPAERDAAYDTLDKGAPSTVQLAIGLLTDASKADRGTSNSERTMQVLAHLYLMHYASFVKAAPPKAATEIAQRLNETTPPGPEMWSAARDAWQAWLGEQQSKGVVPKG